MPDGHLRAILNDMPPHCDSLDGPVVSAARKALAARDPDIVLAYVPKDGEREVRDAYEAVVAIRDEGPAVQAIADRYFFETVVRVHRAGEGAPYTGLKPAGLDHGPLIPVAERAIDTGWPDELVALLTGRVEEEVRERFDHVMKLKSVANGNIDANRAYVEAMLDLQVWSHGLYSMTKASAHAHEQGHVHPDSTA